MVLIVIETTKFIVDTKFQHEFLETRIEWL